MQDLAAPIGEQISTRIKFSGEVDGPARYDLVDMSRSRINLLPYDVTLTDARPDADSFQLDKQGFQIVQHRSDTAFLPDKADLEREYYPEMMDLFRRMTGAREILPMPNGIVRRVGGTGQMAKSRPAHFVHLDYTEQSARHYASVVAELAGRPPVAPYSRFVIYQCWRPLTPPPHGEPLAICDARTIDPADTIAFRTIMEEGDSPRNFESRWVKFNPGQKWYYFSDVRSDEVIIFKGFDSDTGRAYNAAHTAFADSRFIDRVPPRENVEVRMMAFFD